MGDAVAWSASFIYIVAGSGSKYGDGAPLSILAGATTSGSFIAVSAADSVHTGSGSVSVRTRNARLGRYLAPHGQQPGGQRGHGLDGSGEATDGHGGDERALVGAGHSVFDRDVRVTAGAATAAQAGGSSIVHNAGKGFKQSTLDGGDVGSVLVFADSVQCKVRVGLGGPVIAQSGWASADRGSRVDFMTDAAAVASSGHMLLRTAHSRSARELRWPTFQARGACGPATRATAARAKSRSPCAPATRAPRAASPSPSRTRARRRPPGGHVFVTSPPA
jgi:hypothetical protein